MPRRLQWSFLGYPGVDGTVLALGEDIFLITSSDILKSSDFGESFDVVYSGPLLWNGWANVQTTVSQGRLVVMASNAGTYKIWSSADGASWDVENTDVGVSLPATSWLEANGPTYGWASTSWTPGAGEYDASKILSKVPGLVAGDENSDLYMVGTRININIGTRVFYDDINDGANRIFYYYSKALLRSSNHGASWTVATENFFDNSQFSQPPGTIEIMGAVPDGIMVCNNTVYCQAGTSYWIEGPYSSLPGPYTYYTRDALEIPGYLRVYGEGVDTCELINTGGLTGSSGGHLGVSNDGDVSHSSLKWVSPSESQAHTFKAINNRGSQPFASDFGVFYEIVPSVASYLVPENTGRLRDFVGQRILLTVIDYVLFFYAKGSASFDDEDGEHHPVPPVVNPPPEPGTQVWCDFSATPLYGDYPLTVQFTDLSDGSPAFWQWDFGDGDISWDQNPEHEYTLPGIYSVTLMIWNGDLSQSDWLAKSGYITVLDPSGGDYIEAGFTVDVVEGYAPLTVNFTDASGGFAEWWDWDFGDGDSSQEPDPTHTYTTPGTYSVTQTVSRTNDAGDDTISDTTTQENLILVRERPAFYIYANQDGDEKFRWEHKVDGTEQVVLPDETTASLPFSFQDALTDTNVVELGFELEDGLGEYEFVAWTGDCFDPGGSLEGQELSNPLLFQVTDDCTIGCTYRRLV